MASAAFQGIDGLSQRQDQFCVVIRFSPNQSYVLDVQAHMKIRELKEMVAEKRKVKANDINLVLAGEILNEQKTLEDFNLGNHTTLHAFCWSDDGMGAEKVVTGIDISSNNLQTSNQQPADHTEVCTPGESSVDGQSISLPVSTERSAVSEKSHFFVYCKICECIQPGLLRVKCRNCDSGAFLVNRGPNNWEDISYNTSLRGSCKSCGATVPTFYLRCVVSHQGELTGTVAALKHVRNNRRRVECIICGDVYSHILVFPCASGHVICIECFRQYCSSCLNERRFVEHPEHGYTLPCPAGCAGSHIEETHHFILLGKEKYERYKNFGAEEFVIQNGGLLCPARDCGMGLFPEEDQRVVKCGECQFESCRECGQESHLGTCEENLSSQIFSASQLTVDDEQAARASWDCRSLSLIEETTKACPGCRTKTERSGGCMHMVCSRCGEEWCWLCIKKWNRDCQGDHWFG